MKKRAPIRGRKLLKATLGVGVLTFAACAVFPGCNLLPPVSCDEDPTSYRCRDMAGSADAARDAGTSDGGDAGKKDGGEDGGEDGGQTDGSQD